MRYERTATGLQYTHQVKEQTNYHDVLSRLLLLCITEDKENVAKADAGKEPHLTHAPIWQFWPGNLPSQRFGKSDGDLERMNKAFMKCICELRVDFWQTTIMPEGLVDTYDDSRRCIDDFMEEVSTEALSDKSTPIPSPKNHPKWPGSQDGGKKNAIRPFSPSPKRVVGATPEKKPRQGLSRVQQAFDRPSNAAGSAVGHTLDIKKMAQDVGIGITSAASRGKNSISSNVKVQNAMSWKSCMGGCLDKGTPASLIGIAFSTFSLGSFLSN